MKTLQQIAIELRQHEESKIIDGSKLVCLDLFCGLGGWTNGFLKEGYDVIGLDITQQCVYKGKFIKVDVLDICKEINENNKTSFDSYFNLVDVIIASPPCTEFSRHHMPWLKRTCKNPPSRVLVEASYTIHKYISTLRSKGIPFVLENVIGAQKYIGKASCHYGPFYLWGDIKVITIPLAYKHKESLQSTDHQLRAKIPTNLARFVARTLATRIPKHGGSK